MSCDWEGNRRSGVALAMRHILKWFIHLRAQGLSKGDEHPTNTPHGVWYSLLFYTINNQQLYAADKHDNRNRIWTNENLELSEVMTIGRDAKFVTSTLKGCQAASLVYRVESKEIFSKK